MTVAPWTTISGEQVTTRVHAGRVELGVHEPNWPHVTSTAKLLPAMARQIAGQLIAHAHDAEHALADKLDEVIAEQRELHAAVVDGETKHRARIEELIAAFTDRDRIELLVQHGGGLVPASLWHDEEGVSLCLDVEVPALRGSGDRNPVAVGEDAIIAWAGKACYTDLDAYADGDRLPLKLAIELLAAEPVPDYSGPE